jgi:hypothetical protein
VSTTTITVEEISTKEGVSAKTGKPWTKYALKAGGDYYGTFLRSVIEPAMGGEGKTFEIDYEVDGNFKNLKAVRSLSGEAAAQAAVSNTKPNGETDWDLIGLRKTRCALWAAYMHGDVPKSVIAAQTWKETPKHAELADVVYRAGVALIRLAERDIFHRDPATDDEDIAF